MTDRTLLLFDLDGVLIHPKAYKAALISTVEHFASRLGCQNFNLTYDEIAFFESCGMTNEWISAALCVSALITTVIQSHPELIQNTLPDTLRNGRINGIKIKRLDVKELTSQIYSCYPGGIHTTRPILAYLSTKVEPNFHPILIDILRNVQPPASLISRIFQNYTLGSTLFEKTYSIRPELISESLLITLDESNLNEYLTNMLLNMHNRHDFGISIYTARPSRPPIDLSSGEQVEINTDNYPPEGDLAVKLLGFGQKIPLIAGGRMAWLADKYGQAYEAFIKPSPVQALAAIGAAYSGHEKASLLSAITLVQEGRLISPLEHLSGKAVKVVIFEDSMGGIHAGQQAVNLLQSVGIDIHLLTVGISREQTKIASLEKIADRVAPDIITALDAYIPY